MYIISGEFEMKNKLKFCNVSENHSNFKTPLAKFRQYLFSI